MLYIAACGNEASVRKYLKMERRIWQRMYRFFAEMKLREAAQCRMFFSFRIVA